MNDSETLITPLNQLIAFITILILGLTGWIVFQVILLPEPLAIPNYAGDVVTQITPNLSEGAVDLMKQGRVFTETELSTFPLYAGDTKRITGDTLDVDIYVPTVPYDPNYSASVFNAATPVNTENVEF